VLPEFTACGGHASKDAPCATDGDAATNFAGCDDLSRSPVVHQWDRHAGQLGGFIEQKIACRQNCIADPW